jgi:hypothetical protein
MSLWRGSEFSDYITVTFHLSIKLALGLTQFYEKLSMSAEGVRRDKAAFSSGCESHPAIAPAGSN